MDSKLLNRADLDLLKGIPEFRKYQHYQALWLEYLKDQWAEGAISDQLELASASGKAQLLKDMVGLDYDDVYSFFVNAGHIKETEEDGDNTDTESE
jgi:hypothetical protein